MEFIFTCKQCHDEVKINDFNLRNGFIVCKICINRLCTNSKCIYRNEFQPEEAFINKDGKRCKYCEKCRNYENERKKKRRSKLKQNNKCTYCGRHKNGSSGNSCNRCKTKKNSYNRTHYATRIKNKKCAKCGNIDDCYFKFNNNDERYKRCIECNDKENSAKTNLGKYFSLNRHLYPNIEWCGGCRRLKSKTLFTKCWEHNRKDTCDKCIERGRIYILNKYKKHHIIFDTKAILIDCSPMILTNRTLQCSNKNCKKPENDEVFFGRWDNGTFTAQCIFCLERERKRGTKQNLRRALLKGVKRRKLNQDKQNLYRTDLEQTESHSISLPPPS